MKIFRTALFFPLLSVGLVSIAVGLLNTLLPIMMYNFHESDFSIGIITSLFYVGFLIACLTLVKTIVNNGYEKSFIAFAAIFAIFVLIQGLFYNKTLWAICRMLQGFSLAGIYMAIESWLLSYSKPNVKGKILATYMMSIYGMQALGQYLIVLEKNGILPFCIANVLIILAIIPLSITPNSSTESTKYKSISLKKLISKAPIGMYICGLSGIFISVCYGLVPLYLRVSARSLTEISIIMSLIIVGGMMLQFPFGYLSDIFERKLVLRYLLLVLAIVIAIIVLHEFYFQNKNFYFNLLMFLFGGLIFAIYPISMSRVCDAIETEEVVDATRHMLFVYVLGSIIGPLVISVFMGFMFNMVIFIILIILSVLGGLITFIHERKAPTPEEEGEFIPLATTSPLGAELDPRGED